MNKVNINVIKEEKIDNRVNNTGRPVNLKSARQVRLAKQKLYTQIHNAFVSGKKFKINNDSSGVYVYTHAVRQPNVFYIAYSCSQTYLLFINMC